MHKLGICLAFSVGDWSSPWLQRLQPKRPSACMGIRLAYHPAVLTCIPARYVCRSVPLTPACSGAKPAGGSAAAAAGRLSCAAPTADGVPAATAGWLFGKILVLVVTPGMPKVAMPVVAVRTPARGALSSRHISSTLLFGLPPSIPAQALCADLEYYNGY